jgi:hypothetical protein
MFINWLEQRLEPKQFASLKKLVSTLIEIVYVNVLFMAMASIIFLPLLALIFWSDTPMSGSGNCYAPPDGCH